MKILWLSTRPCGGEWKSCTADGKQYIDRIANMSFLSHSGIREWFHWNHWFLRWVAARYSSWEWIAGYEIMSEPRTKIAPQSEVTAFSFKEFFRIEKNTSGDSFLWEAVPSCAWGRSSHSVCRWAGSLLQGDLVFLPCICMVCTLFDYIVKFYVLFAIIIIIIIYNYFKVWQLDEQVLISDPNVIYTFDFFHPWSFISNETGAVRIVNL